LENLGSRTREGVSLGFYVQIATQGIQFVFGLILARLLFPDQYGLVGMLAIFLALFEMLTDSGFGMAIIQKKTPTAIDYSTVFWFNFIFSLLLYVILFLLSPAIASFYHEEKLVSILRVLGLVSVINSFGSIQGKYLNKNLQYISLSKVYMVSFISGSIVAVIFAYLGFGVWSLVIKSLATASLLNFGWWIVSSWKPQFKFSISSLKQLFGFGSKMLGINIIEVLFNNLYSIIIGKFFNAQSLGFFTRAKQFCDLPDRTFRSSTISTLFNGLSHVQDDDEKLLRVYKKVLSLLSFVLFPIYAVLGVIAYPMIKILLTEKWLFSVGYLQILCIMAITFPFESVNGNLLYVKGKSDYLFIITVIRRIIFIAIIILLVKYGVAALVWGLVLDAFIITFLYIIFATKVFTYRFIDQIIDVLPVFVITMFTLILMIVTKSFFENSYIQFFIVPATGMTFYVIMSYLFRRDNLFEVLRLIKFIK
jgi:O-antigen/teichoic acid export membrane protein